jgi:hypothetical protein
MKNLYDTIEQNLKAGLQVVVKDLTDSDQTYCTLSNLKDSEGNYRMSNWCESIEKAKQCIGSYSGNLKEYWNFFDLEIVEVFRPKYEPFKVGDKVRLLDSIKNCDCWKKLFEDENRFPDMIGVIKKVYLEVTGTNYNVNGWHIGHEYLAPLVVEEETIKIGDHTYSKSEVEKRLQGLKEI